MTPKSILFVEDNVDDFIFASIALSKVRVRNKIARVGSAVELLNYLHGMHDFNNREKYPMPAVIMMDMDLPGPDGMKAQAMVRSTLNFREIPIITISGCETVAQLKAAVTCGANAWMLKPFSAVQFINIARDLELDIEYENPEQTATPRVAVS